MTSAEWRFPRPDGTEWVVRSYVFPTERAARTNWEALAGKAKPGSPFSLWRIVIPQELLHVIVLCGEEIYLPEVKGGAPFELDYESARGFVLRRIQGIFESKDGMLVSRYEDAPRLLDLKTGLLKEF